MSKIKSVEEAAAMIKDNSCIWLAAGGGGINEPCLTLAGVEKRFLDTGSPKNLTVCHSAGIGNKCGGGVDRFAHKGMVKKVIGSHWTWSEHMQKLAMDEEIEAYVLPQGTMVQLTREIASKRPGVITRIGLGTFVDPRVEGGGMNSRSKEQLAKHIHINDREYLIYGSFPIDVAILRGTTADEAGNISLEEEGIVPEILSAAQAAKNSGGIVIVQVKRVVKWGSLNPKNIKIPGVLVDALVVDDKQRQSFKTDYNPACSGETRGIDAVAETMPFSERKIIARRAAAEINDGDILNLGFGMPDGVAAVLKEQGRDKKITMTIEQGVLGGVPAGGSDFGMAFNPEAIIDQPYQFDWYDGGGLDVAVLSFAQFDKYGNVNVSKFGERINGVGGFINISQATKKVLFVGTFTTGGLKLDLGSGSLGIANEGKVIKAVDKVDQICFSGKYALENGQEIYYITERAVFKLTEDGIELIETAPGIDIEKDIVANMGFKPIIKNVKAMDLLLFKE